jgi:hypothetical protein
MPRKIVERMRRELEGRSNPPSSATSWCLRGSSPSPVPPAAFVAFITAERERLSRLTKKANMKAG